MTDETISPARDRTWLSAVAALVLVALVAALAVALSTAPAPRGLDVAQGEFSAARAAAHLAEIARRPHPTGSAENLRVRDYLVAQARAAGAEVTVESGEVVRPDWGNPFPAAVVHNVLARVPGRDPGLSGGKAVLVVAHYDSVPTGPGASDDGAAVAGMLETMRALRAGPGLANDVLFLFTDGEELGCLGAAHFVRRHGLDDYGVVLNWEARGSHGPVLLFETSPGNENLIDAFADASSRPIGNSMAYEVYRRMPNDSDFTVFLAEGAVGTNAAYIRGLHDYHSPNDDLTTVSQASVQHHGDTMLGMIADLGDRDLRAVPGSDAVFFDLFGRVLVHYPAVVAIVLAVLTVLGLAAALVVSARRGGVRFGRVVSAGAIVLGTVFVCALVATALWIAATALRPETAALPLSEPHLRNFYVAGFGLASLAVLLGTARVLGRTWRRAEVLGGVCLLVALALLATITAAPGASYLFQWPLLAALPALWWFGRTPESSTRGAGPAGVLAATAGPLVAAVLYAALVDNMFVALGIALAGVPVALAVLGAAHLLPLLGRVPRPGAAALASAVCALGVIAVPVVRGEFAVDRPRPDAVVYVRDLTDGSSRWISGDPEPDEWTAKVLGADPERRSASAYYPQRGQEPVLAAAAPVIDLAAPTATVVSEETVGGVRKVAVHAVSRRQAWQLQIRLPSGLASACTVAGTRMDAAALAKQGEGAEGVVFQYWGAVDGVRFECEVPAGQSLPLDLTDLTPGLPPEAADLLGPRSPGHVSVAHGFNPTDAAVVRTTVTL